MIETIDHKTTQVSQLIHSCYRAQNGYRLAADMVDDGSLKRLFEIYAQQRIRFAEELREYLSADEFAVTMDRGRDLLARSRTATSQESIRECLEMEARNLALYKEALAHRGLPTRAHLVISSQLALMERVHDRMSLMLNERVVARPALQARGVLA